MLAWARGGGLPVTKLMTTFLLIRHASHDLLGKVVTGRLLQVFLNAKGRSEAARLVQRLAGVPIDVLYASPRERTQQTAAPIAHALQAAVCINSEIDEVDVGDWAGRAFSQLKTDPQWSLWCNQRSLAQPPGGETIGQVQERIVGELTRLAIAHPNQTVAIFSHGDVIKSALAHYLAIALDELERFEIAPASISIVLMGSHWAKVVQVNETGAWPT